MPLPVRSKSAQRMGGVFLILLGFGATAYLWHTALNDGSYWPFAAILFPAVACFGLIPLLYPMNEEEWIAKHSLPSGERFRLYKPGQWVIFGFGVAAGLLNFAFMSGTIPLP